MRRRRYRSRAGAYAQAVAEDPENALRRCQAVVNMDAFDRLGPETRAAIRSSRFDASAPEIARRYGWIGAEDARVAARVRADDDFYSGRFGPAAAAGI